MKKPKQVKDLSLRGGQLAQMLAQRDDLPSEGKSKGVYGAQNGITIMFPKKDAYRNAIAINVGKQHLCVCGTPTDHREVGWVDGAPVMRYICPMCGTEHHPVVIEL